MELEAATLREEGSRLRQQTDQLRAEKHRTQEALVDSESALAALRDEMAQQKDGFRQREAEHQQREQVSALHCTAVSHTMPTSQGLASLCAHSTALWAQVAWTYIDGAVPAVPLLTACLVPSLQLVEELSLEIERLREAERAHCQAARDPEQADEQAARVLALGAQLERVREEARSLREANEELQALVLARGVEEGRSLLTGSMGMGSASLAAELEAMSQDEVRHFSIAPFLFPTGSQLLFGTPSVAFDRPFATTPFPAFPERSFK